jgi:TrmH family RNA methyltransferase
MLTSPQNGRVKLVRQLQKQNEVRQSEGLFVAEGLRLTDDFLRAGISASFAFIGEHAAAQKWHEDHRSVECIDVSEAIMRSVSQETTPPGVLVVFDLPRYDTATLAQSLPEQVLILDALRDPGNLGACLRVAAGSDCRLVLLSPDCVDPYNPKVVRGGMGAHARIRVANVTWDDIHILSAGRRVWAADANGDYTYDAVNWTKPNALIIGSEANGLSTEARAQANGLVTIPLANSVESLNAAVACGVMLFESARQRRET